MAAIKLLKYLEETTGQATPEQQEVLSRYVGWGGVPEAFDPSKTAWAKEYAELKELLTRRNTPLPGPLLSTPTTPALW